MNDGKKIEILNGHAYLIENEGERNEMSNITSSTPYIYEECEVVMTYELFRLLNDENKRKEIMYLVIGEGCGNELRRDLRLSDYSNLKELLILSNSVRNLKSLTISNNPCLSVVVIGGSDSDKDGCLEIVETTELSSMMFVIEISCRSSFIQDV